MSKSRFYGFECLVFLVAVHFALIYLVTNYFEKGDILNLDVLKIVISNLILDFLSLLGVLTLAMLQLRIADILITLSKGQKIGSTIVHCYNLVWFGIFVVGGVVTLSQN